MAVFTDINEVQLNQFLKCYFDHFQVTRFEGIPAGIENSNFWLDVNLDGKASHWVLTVFEMSEGRELPSIVRLTQHLAMHGLPVPAPFNDQLGGAIQRINGKPGLLVPKTAGQHISSPKAGDCQQVGQFLGKMHRVASSLESAIPLKRDLWWLKHHLNELFQHSQPAVDQADLSLLKSEILCADQLVASMQDCPAGWVHGDLFVDNALFLQGELVGIIDFYHACSDHLINDLAVCCNDWCYRQGKGYQPELMEALIFGYQQERRLSTNEKKIWPDALRLGALRFWVSRLVSKYTDTYQRDALSGEVYKDPDEIKLRLLEAGNLKPLK